MGYLRPHPMMTEPHRTFLSTSLFRLSSSLVDGFLYWAVRRKEPAVSRRPGDKNQLHQAVQLARRPLPAPFQTTIPYTVQLLGAKASNGRFNWIRLLSSGGFLKNGITGEYPR